MFCLHGWCMLGVFLYCWHSLLVDMNVRIFGTCARDFTSAGARPQFMLALERAESGVRIYVNSKRKIPKLDGSEGCSHHSAPCKIVSLTILSCADTLKHC